MRCNNMLLGEVQVCVCLRWDKQKSTINEEEKSEISAFSLNH